MQGQRSIAHGSGNSLRLTYPAGYVEVDFIVNFFQKYQCHGDIDHYKTLLNKFVAGRHHCQFLLHSSFMPKQGKETLLTDCTAWVWSSLSIGLYKYLLVWEIVYALYESEKLVCPAKLRK